MWTGWTHCFCRLVNRRNLPLEVQKELWNGAFIVPKFDVESLFVL